MRALNENILHEITQRLADQFHPEQIIMFGSQAWGAPTPYSDIDLMVIVSKSGVSEYERSVQGHRCLMGLNIAKDVIVKTRAEFDFFKGVPASLEYKIAHEGRVLYDRCQSPTREELAHQSES
jgi:uncharacterized protein